MRKAFFLLLVTALIVMLVPFAIAQDAPAAPAAPAAGGGADDTVRVEDTLIDFNLFETELTAEPAASVGDGKLYPDADTLRGKPLIELTAEEVDPYGAPKYQVTSAEMYLDRWLVELNSSADNIENRVKSYCKKVPLKSDPNTFVLGARVHFPTWHYNSWARIRPPFPILAYNTDGKVVHNREGVERGIIGVIENVGMIETISVDVAGRNYLNGLAIRLTDSTEEVSEYFMGYLNFVGFRTLTWRNPNYIKEIQHRDIFRLPLYPREKPYIKFDSFIIYRQADKTGGDFVIYFKNIKVKYDQAISKDELAQLDVEDETIWEILTTRYNDRNERQRRVAADTIDKLRQETARKQWSGN